MKQWLQQNKIGPYKHLLAENLGDAQAKADREMEEEDDKNSDMVSNVNMGTVAEGRGGVKSGTATLDEEPFNVLGKEYLVSGEVDFNGEFEEEGFVIDNATLTIKELKVENGDNYRVIQNPEVIKIVQDLINTNSKLQYELNDAIVGSNFDFSTLYEDAEMDEQIGIGYASITKPSDPNYR